MLTHLDVIVAPLAEELNVGDGRHVSVSREESEEERAGNKVEDSP